MVEEIRKASEKESCVVIAVKDVHDKRDKKSHATKVKDKKLNTWWSRSKTPC